MIDLGEVIPLNNEKEYLKYPGKVVRRPLRQSSSTTSLPLNPLSFANNHNNSLSSLQSDESSLSLSNNSAAEIEYLRKKNVRLKKQRDKAVTSLQTMQSQQKQLYDDFQLLRDKYDDLKSEMHRLLWDYIPKHCTDKPIKNNPCFNEILQEDPTVFETCSRIGDYTIGPVLGEGQFADVKLCTQMVSKKQLAVKVLRKSKVVTLCSLRRIQTEINVLRKLEHPNIVTLVNVIHSPKSIYVMTELAGKDLFDFFDANPMGVRGRTAREIVLGIVAPIVYLHSLGICHRDLKPENVLLFYDASSSSKANEGNHRNLEQINRRNIQICDFGHSAQNVRPGECSLEDLCGSPGFFAPEMILGGERHDGIAADVWSIGCIMLELTRGHDEFCNTWMTCYDFDILQDETKFESILKQAIGQVNESIKSESVMLDETEDGPFTFRKMTDFLNNLLTIDPTLRLDSRLMMSQPWLSGDSQAKSTRVETETNASISSMKNTSNNNENRGESSIPYQITINNYKRTKKLEDQGNKIKEAEKKTRFLRDSMSNRARRHFNATFDMIKERSNAENSSNIIALSSPPPKKRLITDANTEIDVRLPPIEKTTPSRERAKKSLLEGKKLVLALDEIDSYNYDDNHSEEQQSIQLTLLPE